MKKTIISVLMVLLLSLVLFGCGKECEVCGEVDCICKAASASNLSSDAITDLGKMSISGSDVLTPEGTTFLKHEYYPATNKILIFWKDANQAMFDYYKSAWLARPSRAPSVVGDHSPFSSCNIEFFSDAGTLPVYDIVYPAGTIVLEGIK